MEQKYTLGDFLEHLKVLKQLGPLGDVSNLIPGMAAVSSSAEVGLLNASVMLERAEKIFNAMTEKEREDPLVIGDERKAVIAKGAGLTVDDVANLLQQFKHSKEVQTKLDEID